MRTALFATALSVFSLASFASAQASVALIGTACTTADGTPNMQVTGLPQLGTTMDFDYTGPNFVFSAGQTIAQPLFVFGFSLIGPLTIPTGLFFMQPPGCDIFPANDIVIAMQPVGPTSDRFMTQQRLTLSNDPVLIGFTFFTQWLTTNTQCGFAGCNGLNYVATSEAAVCTVGV